MDASMKVQVALGTLDTDGRRLTPDQQVAVIRHLTEERLCRHIRNYEPMSEILAARATKHGRHPRSVHSESLTMRPDSLKLDAYVELYDEMVWDPETMRDRQRHDRFIYLSRQGLLVLWSGACQMMRRHQDHVAVYSYLSVVRLADEEIAKLFKKTPALFETLVENLRVLHKSSLDRAEIAIREERDALRTVSEAQRRMKFFPENRIRD